MVTTGRSQWKAEYFKRFSKTLSDFDKCFIVNVDNVRSKQMQQIRMALRDTATVIMGKNTLMRKVIRGQLARDTKLEKLLPHVHENVGFVFTDRELVEVREFIEANRIAAPAKAGTIAPADVVVPAQNTGLGPEKTSFFQALAIPTKITRTTIEILTDVHIIHKGSKVGQSEAALLNMLKIYPFTYGLVIQQVYDQGSVYGPEVLDITPDIMIEKFLTAVSKVAAVGMAINYPTVATVSHMLIDGLKNLIALSVETDYTFKESEQIKEYLKDPSKFAVVAPAATSAAPTESKAAPAAESKAKVEEEEEEDSDEGPGSLFD